MDLVLGRPEIGSKPKAGTRTQAATSGSRLSAHESGSTLRSMAAGLFRGTRRARRAARLSSGRLLSEDRRSGCCHRTRAKPCNDEERAETARPIGRVQRVSSRVDPSATLRIRVVMILVIIIIIAVILLLIINQIIMTILLIITSARHRLVPAPRHAAHPAAVLREGPGPRPGHPRHPGERQPRGCFVYIYIYIYIYICESDSVVLTIPSG